MEMCQYSMQKTTTKFHKLKKYLYLSCEKRKKMMKSPYLIYNNVQDGVKPSDFMQDYHVHILCRCGSIRFKANNQWHEAHGGSLVIWQMSNRITNVSYSPDAEMDFLLISWEFLQTYNPEMIWATKGYVLLKFDPVIRLDDNAFQMMNTDFGLFRNRIYHPQPLFQDETIGRLLQVFLFDFWNVVKQELEHYGADDNQSRIFLRFLFLVQEHCKQNRDVAFYADKLFIVPKYLSEICRKVSYQPASDWIEQFTGNELKRLLDDRSLSLTDIADEMNFSTFSFFSRYVKKVLGVTPSEYRKQLS